jgi:dTDP-4-dehydrorhamnose reductase
VQTLELWGGHECTVNRVGNAFRDQTVLSGHHERNDDLDAFASLGLKTLRYPILWERIAPERPDLRDWSWTDRRLQQLRELNVSVIGGLCHHGSGPAYVDLLSPDFAPGLAAHARASAERYPWVEAWTPVNEPLTTARFAALYGHWYPHQRDERSFWLALLNQIDAIRLSMKAIREIIPGARLVQTEDLGRTYATRPLAEQAAHDNARRWMSWDLLFGRVTPEHPFWPRLASFGFADRVSAIADDPCPPDIVGINHYLTSDRFLDHRCERYPDLIPGGNGRQAYVDMEAVRVASPRPAGMGGAMREAWGRYRAPIAITEAHNACTRDEQVRWFARAWSDALAARAEGVDVRAVTAWSLLGAFDWDSLLTNGRGHYEPGAFDISSGERRPTALAYYLKSLAEDQRAAPLLNGRGWWERDIRFVHPPVRVPECRVERKTHPRRRKSARPLLIIGATGTLGQALARACHWRDLDYVLTSRKELSLDDAGSIEAALRRYTPSAAINAAGWVRVDDAERDPDGCRRANTYGAVQLAEMCAEAGVPSVTFSTDLVFDGALSAPYHEEATTNPLNVYGMSKAEAERAILASCDKALIIRTAAFFSPHDPYNFAAWIVRELSAGRSVHCAGDSIVSPTYVPSLADATLDLVLDGERGVWHLANKGAVSWAEFGRRIARAIKLDESRIEERTMAELAWPAPRPTNSALTSSRGALMPDLGEAIWRFSSKAGELPALPL